MKISKTSFISLLVSIVSYVLKSEQSLDDYAIVSKKSEKKIKNIYKKKVLGIRFIDDLIKN